MAAAFVAEHWLDTTTHQELRHTPRGMRRVPVRHRGATFTGARSGSQLGSVETAPPAQSLVAPFHASNHTLERQQDNG